MGKEKALNELERRRQISTAMGGPERIDHQRQKGRLNARERLSKLLDPGSLTEINALQQFTANDGRELHVNRIRGYGQVNGRPVVIQADDSTIQADTGGRSMSGYSRIRGDHASLTPEKNFPIIRLGDSGRTSLRSVMGSTGVLAQTFPSRILLGPRKAPHVTAILGDCFGEATWQATQSDFVVQVKGTCMALSNPKLIQAVTGEKVTPEQLGGWELHANITGEVDAFAEDDEHCMQIIKEYLSYMPSDCHQEPPRGPTSDPVDRKTEKLMDLIPDASTQVYDMNPLIEEIVDHQETFIIKPYFGKVLITCLARMNGRVVGIIANQPLVSGGAPGPDECDKATSFIVMCDSFNIPLVHLADIPGFLVGRAAERKKIPVKIMTWLEALALATVPKISVIVRKSYGMGITNMCGTNCGADFFSALTTADVSFMSPEAAANVVWKRQIAAAEDPEAERKRLIKEMQYGSTPWDAAASGMLDDVIDPRDLRTHIIERLEIMHSRKNGFLSDKLLQNWPTSF